MRKNLLKILLAVGGIGIFLIAVKAISKQKDVVTEDRAQTNQMVNMSGTALIETKAKREIRVEARKAARKKARKKTRIKFRKAAKAEEMAQTSKIESDITQLIFSGN